MYVSLSEKNFKILPNDESVMKKNFNLLLKLLYIFKKFERSFGFQIFRVLKCKNNLKLLKKFPIKLFILKSAFTESNDYIYYLSTVEFILDL